MLATVDRPAIHHSQTDLTKGVNLVLEGGGMKGFGLVGALSLLEDRGFRPRHVAGSSVGAMIATLLAAGFCADDLFDIALETNFKDFRDKDWIDRIPLVGAPLSIVVDKGLYEGNVFTDRMRSLLAEKGVFTFGDLRTGSTSTGVFAYRVQVVVSDLAMRSLLVLPRDAHKLGLDPDSMSVAEVIRMSVSIPIFFEPVRFTNPVTGTEHILVDGGVLSNFPMWLFENDPDSCPTIGLRLDESSGRSKPQISSDSNRLSVLSFVRSLAETMLAAHDRKYLDSRPDAQTISIPTLGVRWVDLGLDRRKAFELFLAGREAAEMYLAEIEGVIGASGSTELI